ncbi:hypothetical protein [Microbacterium aureliae]
MTDGRTRYRTTLELQLPSSKLKAFKRWVDRYAPAEHKWRDLEASYVSVIRDSSSGGLDAVRVLIDALGWEGAGEDAEDAALDTVARAVGRVNRSGPGESARVRDSGAV